MASNKYKTTPFIGRNKELRLLRELRNSEIGASISAIYGRRRIGKSALIKEAYRKEKVLSFEGLENRTTSDQIANFVHQLNKQLPPEKLNKNQKLKSWRDCLEELATRTKNQSYVIVFDEFQWMANYRSELISTLKLIWDQELSNNQNITLVLCGSVASFMVRKVLKSKALYGRVRLAINLMPFTLDETAALLHNCGKREVLDAQLIFGGVPEYLKILSTKKSIYLGIEELAFETHGYFTEEFEKIFTSQFGKSDHYEKLVRLLAASPRGLTRQQIISKPGFDNGGSLSGRLQDLEIADIVSSYYPFNLGPKSKSRIYILSDPYMRFYLNYIEKNLDRIKTGAPGIFSKLSSSPSFLSWKGLAAEILCYNHKHKIATLLGFSDVEYQAGPYFQSRNKKIKGTQVDLIFNRKDSVMSVCEIKYKNSKIGVEIIEEVESKLELIPNKENKTLQKILISMTPVTKELANRAYFSQVLQFEDLF